MYSTRPLYNKRLPRLAENYHLIAAARPDRAGVGVKADSLASSRRAPAGESHASARPRSILLLRFRLCVPAPDAFRRRRRRPFFPSPHVAHSDHDLGVLSWWRRQRQRRRQRTGWLEFRDVLRNRRLSRLAHQRSFATVKGKSAAAADDDDDEIRR
ncbi:unnamed protein product [Heligmosomoides polygyrus]|uniref:Uncharacterized protein n=1 Tax=Heligmosomoides polygyrus TaxID=6339 RepID=A0A183FVE8_HELPZ|nr:unnamed protein product [Heligmosomoides polygyrus]